MSSVESSTSNPALSIGNGNISQETVDLAVSSLMEFCSKIFARFISEKIKDHYHSGTDYVSKLECLTKQSVKGTISTKSDDKSGEERYSISLVEKVACIDESTSVGALVAQLSKRVEELGFPTEMFDVRFEKGFLDSLTPYWHYDPEPSFIERNSPIDSINTCYSNKKNWNTRILDRDKHKIPNLYAISENQKTKDLVEAASEPAKFGYIYDGQKVFHRSPIQKDLEGDLTADDYRLFIRFFTWQEKSKG